MGSHRSERISAIIPTRGRPRLVLRAVNSALNQTLLPEEVIVVLDGPDNETADVLRQVEDPRLKVLQLPGRVGPSDARNAGVATARGERVAFLDDDDEWLPRKLEVQAAAANRSRYALPVVTCRFLARTPDGEFVWPRRLPAPSEPISEYLMVRRGAFLGETWIGTPTILASTELLREVPFGVGLQVHEDWDWVLRASRRADVGIEFVDEPLAVCYIQERRQSASSAHGWRRSLDWIRSNRDLVTPRAYAGFIATVVSPAAARRGEWGALVPLLRETFDPGRPRFSDLSHFAAMWMVPQGMRRRLRAILTGR